MASQAGEASIDRETEPGALGGPRGQTIAT
jgi:hypothetical protein